MCIDMTNMILVYILLYMHAILLRGKSGLTPVISGKRHQSKQRARIAKKAKKPSMIPAMKANS